MLDEPKVQRSIARFGHSAVAHSNRMYVLGGFNGIVLGDMFVYEPGEICDIAVTYSVSPHFDDHSPAEPGLASTRMSPFLILLERRMTEVVVIAEAIRAHCTSLTKWLTRELTIWLSVDALHETLTLG